MLDRQVGALLVLVALSSSALADDKPLAGDEMMRKHLARETREIAATFLDGVTSGADWERIRPRMREQYLDMLGLWPLPERTDLHATITGTVERDTFRVEKLHFQSRPGLYVTANLYLPGKIEGRLPAVLYVCGHSGRGRDGNKTAFGHHGIWFATHGYVCLILDTLQLGEIAAIHHGTYRERRWWWHSAGYTPAGVECWNGTRAIDYLVSRPEVDPERIAVTGISGGGASTFWITAADDRVKVAVPVSGMTDLETNVIDRVVEGHCDCMFLYNRYRWPWANIAALVAPRPLLFANSDRDTIFPMPGNERLRERIDRLYGLLGARDRFAVCVVPGGHNDKLELRLMAYRWISRFLKDDASDVSEPDVPSIEGKELRVFPEDSDVPADQINTRIDETFVPRVRLAVPTAGDLEGWKKARIAELRRLAFDAWPESYPNARLGSEESGRTPTEPPVYVTWRRFASPDADGTVQWLLVLGEDDPQDALPEWAGDIVGRQSVLAVSPRGIGPTRWTRKNPPNTIERSLALLGRTADSGRVWDVMVMASLLREQLADDVGLRVLGRGPAGVIGAYAALFEPAISRVVIHDPTASHTDGPYFLNILRLLDIPDALGLLAPRPLTLRGRADPALEKTAEFYRAFNAATHLDRQAQPSEPTPAQGGVK